MATGTKSVLRTASILSLLALVAACAQQPVQPQAAEQMQIAFVVEGEGGSAIARALMKGGTCPVIEIDGKARAMDVRAPSATEIVRGGGAEQAVKPAAFPVLTCEALLPRGTSNARIGDTPLHLPRAEVRRIVIIADTGCRMKQSDHAFQSCNDQMKWPFARVAESAAALKPDLVIHIGDIHYRETPCPEGNAVCAGSPWGYGYDTWEADLFKPARPLLNAAPWVFVRGNHESCSRAGQGWFRFIDPNPWRSARSCNEPSQDADADFTDPYAVPLTPDTQLIVFDSSKAGAKAYSADEEAFKKYLPQLRQAGDLAKKMQHSFFLNHHPVLGFAPGKENTVKPGSESLQSVMRVAYPNRLYPDGVDFAMNGHVHLFESISFSSDHPATIVMGNAGSATEGGLPDKLPPHAEPAPGAVVEDFSTRSEFGFATLDRAGDGWQLTEWDISGKPVFLCDLRNAKSHCQKM